VTLITLYFLNKMAVVLGQVICMNARATGSGGFMTSLTWRSAGACLAADPDLFFPVSAGGPGREDIRRAKAMCARCPVRAQCLAFAEENAIGYGIWGGTTPDERERSRRRVRRRVRAAERADAAASASSPRKSSALSG
jgi:WhiB family transcriptional regulator, redox-sensing transcriptional regulator